MAKTPEKKTVHKLAQRQKKKTSMTMSNTSLIQQMPYNGK